MDPDFLESKRRYKNQILDAMNEKPQQFIRTTRAPLPRRRVPAEPPHRAATGAELQAHGRGCLAGRRREPYADPPDAGTSGCLQE